MTYSRLQDTTPHQKKQKKKAPKIHPTFFFRKKNTHTFKFSTNPGGGVWGFFSQRKRNVPRLGDLGFWILTSGGLIELVTLQSHLGARRREGMGWGWNLRGFELPGMDFTGLIWMFPKIVVPPRSSNLIGFSIINHPFWDTPIFGNTHFTPNNQHLNRCFLMINKLVLKKTIGGPQKSSCFMVLGSHGGLFHPEYK